MKLRTRITRGGQISIPAAIRRRWATDNILLEDSGGDELVLRPLPADPIDAAIGSLPLPAGLTAERLRARARAEEQREARPPARGRVTTLFDAYALIAALAGEPAASEVEAELRKGGAGITAVNLAEVIDQLVRPARRSQQDVDTSLASLVAGGLGVIPIDESIGRLAGGLRARHYDRRSAPISLADCVALAASSILGATLATADPPLAAVAKRTGVKVLGLPDSTGRRP